MAETVTGKLGYYIQDDGETVYLMQAEPPEGQFVLHGDVWELLIDPWYLMDMIIDGNPTLSDPMVNPPEGVPPHSTEA